MATSAEKREISKRSGGKGAVYYIDGNVGAGTISLVFEKEYAKAFARGLLDAAESSPDGARDVGMELDVKLIPKDKVMIIEGGITQ